MTKPETANRWTVSAIALLIAVIGNLLQLIIGFNRGTNTGENIVSQYKNFDAQGIYFFVGKCEDQAALLQSHDAVIVGIFPMFFAESIVLALGTAFCFLVLNVTRSFEFSRTIVLSGLTLSSALLVLDQGRYLYTSILDADKLFFTWSSYCINGTWGWVFDLVGYLGFYLLLALAISGYLASLTDFRAIDWNEATTSAQEFVNKPLVALDATLSWLTYFAYAYLLIWLVFSGITPNASKLYAAQVVIIFAVIFAFYFVTVWSLARSYFQIEKLKPNFKQNPIADLYAPHGTRLVEIFIKLSLPAVLFLSVWFDWLKGLLSFLQG
ncbi:hypothetical protein BCF46_3253 [Litoreibacter meonggei]|uniref:Uncharacterized protein n=1 Tax=Litoreibacter meonggei TaxID=1049199 RepID=A0A497VP34_9RHOB|nr:hypothetical protein [Litoreibacter meonggei]RLJ40684.1 hypothetical protein BCF46_3253 [Litoreibacter meonggei]